jgi:hypothetical protein
MKAIEDLKRRMEAIGGSLDNYADFFCLDAPSGYVWSANGLHSITIRWANNSGQTWLTKAIREESAAIAMGLEKVTNEESIKAARYDLDDDSWGAPYDAPEKLFLPK